MEIIALLILIILLFINYNVFDKDIVAPPVIFILTFCISFFDALLNLGIWNTALSINTILIIVVGALVFTIVSVLLRIISKKNVNKSEDIIVKYIDISKWKLMVFLIFQLVVIFFVQKYVKELAGPYAKNGSLSASISMYQYLTKFTTLKLAFPKVLTYTYILSNSSAFVFGYVAVYNFFYSRKINYLAIINMLVSMAGSFLTGSRGVAIQVILSLIIIYLLLYRDNGGKIKLSVLVKPLLVLIGLLLSFRFFAKILGRDHSLGLFEYISVYLGAPIKNLDTFLNTGYHSSNDIWGFNTFSMQWQWINEKFSLGLPKDTINVNMQFLNGHNLGNVFTAYKDYISDFGYFGATICIVVMAFVMGYLYEHTKIVEQRESKTAIKWSRLLFGYLSVNMAFTFFSNKFYESFTVTMGQRVICWMLLSYILCDVIVVGGNIDERKERL